MDARERGIAADEAAEAAGRYMAEVKHVEVSSAWRPRRRSQASRAAP